RGTKGRVWHSPPDGGLYMSVILRPPGADLSLLPLAAGLGVRDGILDAAGISVGLRWPNDLVWRGLKIGGILCEAGGSGGAGRFAVVGVGLNLSQQPDDFPEEIRAKAASLRMAGGRYGDVQRLASAVWAGLDRRYAVFRDGRSRELIEAYRAASSFGAGAVLTLRRGDGEAVRGRWAGFDDRGGLVLELPDGRSAFYSAEEVTVEDAG
ncbi:MAG: biotin--[acetyl-CoA-carboxylase] ligase, partial [Candidatus Aminicenantes bacterium]|nr:biotin--[acetyl-CoA-carboxylase] ligase [Candidatus Aminicenantes bacterium]